AARHTGLSLANLVSLLTLLVLGQWVCGYVLERYRESRLSRTFRTANDFVSGAWLALLLVAVYLPLLAVDLARPFVPGLPHELDLLRDVSWPCRLLIVLWSFDAARRQGSRLFASLGC